MQAHDDDKYDGWLEYVMYGGLPQPTSLKTPEKKVHYLTSLFKEVYLADVMERNHLMENIVHNELVARG